MRRPVPFRDSAFVKYILIQPIHSFHNKRMRDCKIYTDCIRPVKGPSVLPDNADADTRSDKLIHGFMMLFTPFFTIQI